jgi:hypothetical protein
MILEPSVKIKTGQGRQMRDEILSQNDTPFKTIFKSEMQPSGL